MRSKPPSDLFTASTVLLAIHMSPYLRQAYSEPLESLNSSWEEAATALKYYEGCGISFAKRCLWTLQTAFTQAMHTSAQMGLDGKTCPLANATSHSEPPNHLKGLDFNLHSNQPCSNLHGSNEGMFDHGNHPHQRLATYALVITRPPSIRFFFEHGRKPNHRLLVADGWFRMASGDPSI